MCFPELWIKLSNVPYELTVLNQLKKEIGKEKDIGNGLLFADGK